MKIHLIGAFVRNWPFGSEIAFAKGLQAAGHTVTTSDPSQTGTKLDRSADAIIVFKDAGDRVNAELAALKGPVKVVYQPDDSRFQHVIDDMKRMRAACDFAFTFDSFGVDNALASGYKAARCLLLTADPELYRPVWGVKKEHDACFIGHLSNGPHHASRMRMVKFLHDAGRSVVIMNGCYDVKAICDLISRCHVSLNHATDVGQPFGYGYGYQCRHFEVAMAGGHLVSNVVSDEGQLSAYMRRFSRFSTEEMLLSIVDRAKANEEESAFQALRFHDDVMANHTPLVRAKQIIKFVEEFACVST
jgi:hypothetical protein